MYTSRLTPCRSGYQRLLKKILSEERKNNVYPAYRMNVYEFADFVKEHPDLFVNYYEFIIDKLGFIWLAIPSHKYKVLQLVADKYNISWNAVLDQIPYDCDPYQWCLSKEGFIAVHNKFYIRPKKINKFQRHTLRVLLHRDIIEKGVSKYLFKLSVKPGTHIPNNIEIADEYYRYLYRAKLDAEERTRDQRR